MQDLVKILRCYLAKKHTSPFGLNLIKLCFA